MYIAIFTYEEQIDSYGNTSIYEISKTFVTKQSLEEYITEKPDMCLKKLYIGTDVDFKVSKKVEVSKNGTIK